MIKESGTRRGETSVCKGKRSEGTRDIPGRRAPSGGSPSLRLLLRRVVKTQFVRAYGPRGLPRRAWASSRPLSFVGATMLLVLAVSLAGLLFDPRVITGAPAWLKPMKTAKEERR